MILLSLDHIAFKVALVSGAALLFLWVAYGWKQTGDNDEEPPHH